MLAQIEEYAAGDASDPFLDVAGDMPARGRERISASLHAPLFISGERTAHDHRYPRYRELDDARNDSHDRMSIRDLRDLQVLSQLVWFDEDLLARDPELLELTRKGRDYSGDDSSNHGAQTRASRWSACSRRTVIRYPPRTDRNFNHSFLSSILPLICDSDIARFRIQG